MDVGGPTRVGGAQYPQPCLGRESMKKSEIGFMDGLTVSDTFTNANEAVVDNGKMRRNESDVQTSQSGHQND